MRRRVIEARRCRRHGRGNNPQQEGIVMTTDPVCGMEVEEASAAAEAVYQGNRYYFCSESCREEFLSHPDQYIEEGPGVYA
jgi:YHS domain-containing protein